MSELRNRQLRFALQTYRCSISSVELPVSHRTCVIKRPENLITGHDSQDRSAKVFHLCQTSSADVTFAMAKFHFFFFFLTNCSLSLVIVIQSTSIFLFLGKICISNVWQVSLMQLFTPLDTFPIFIGTFKFYSSNSSYLSIHKSPSSSKLYLLNPFLKKRKINERIKF